MLGPVTGAPNWNEIVTGEIAGSATASQLPDVAAQLFEVSARSDNAGNVYLGGSGVTKPDGTTDVTTGIQFLPGQCRLMFVPNLKTLYRICDNAGDDLTYIGYK